MQLHFLKEDMGLHQVLFSVFFTLLLSIASCSRQVSCRSHQSNALLQFSKSLPLDANSSYTKCDHLAHITSFPKTASWSENSGCCSWDGVACDNTTGMLSVLTSVAAGFTGVFIQTAPSSFFPIYKGWTSPSMILIAWHFHLSLVGSQAGHTLTFLLPVFWVQSHLKYLIF